MTAFQRVSAPAATRSGGSASRAGAKEERRAWKLATLFGSNFAGRTSVLETHAPDGRPTMLADALAPSPQGVWVLRTNKKGSTVLAQVDAADPFPAYHGQGGIRGRPGETEGERVREVVRLRLLLGPASTQRPERPTATPALVVEVDGAVHTLDEQALSPVEKLAIVGDSGEGSRPAWSLRALARHVGGHAARVTSVLGAEGERLEIDPVTWADVSRVPVLRLNRRGDFKFHWIDAAAVPLNSAPALRRA